MYFIMSIIFYVSSPVAPHRLFATINLAMVILPFFIVSAPCAITYGAVAGRSFGGKLGKIWNFISGNKKKVF